jgi:hypothetical protein
MMVLGGYQCQTCGSRCHRECKEILPLNCSEIAALRDVLPAFFMGSSAEEARRWVRSIEAAQRASRESW